MFYWISTLVLVILALGFWQRRHRKNHILLMSTAFAIDVGLVLAIELQRHAVEKVVGDETTAFVIFHAAISLMVLLLYTAMAVLGRKIVTRQPNARLWHGRLAGVFVLFRLTNYVTSFYM